MQNRPLYTLEYLENGIFVTKQCPSQQALLRIMFNLPDECGAVLYNPFGMKIWPASNDVVKTIDPKLPNVIVYQLAA